MAFIKVRAVTAFAADVWLRTTAIELVEDQEPQGCRVTTREGMAFNCTAHTADELVHLIGNEESPLTTVITQGVTYDPGMASALTPHLKE